MLDCVDADKGSGDALSLPASICERLFSAGSRLIPTYKGVCPIPFRHSLHLPITDPAQPSLRPRQDFVNICTQILYFVPFMDLHLVRRKLYSNHGGIHPGLCCPSSPVNTAKSLRSFTFTISPTAR